MTPPGIESGLVAGAYKVNLGSLCFGVVSHTKGRDIAYVIQYMSSHSMRSNNLMPSIWLVAGTKRKSFAYERDKKPLGIGSHLLNASYDT